jgi:hypothetical protein
MVRDLRVRGERDSPLIDGCIAQLVEQLTLNQRVVGSNPTTPTMAPKGFRKYSQVPPVRVRRPR